MFIILKILANFIVHQNFGKITSKVLLIAIIYFLLAKIPKCIIIGWIGFKTNLPKEAFLCNHNIKMNQEKTLN